MFIDIKNQTYNILSIDHVGRDGNKLNFINTIVSDKEFTFELEQVEFNNDCEAMNEYLRIKGLFEK